MNRRRLVPLVLLAYSVAVWLGIEMFNYSGGGYIQRWYEEYYVNGVPSGSMKWRSPDGKSFAEFSLVFGTWVYPFCVIASVLYLRMVASASGTRSKTAALMGALLCLAILGRFLYLGVFTAVASG